MQIALHCYPKSSLQKIMHKFVNEMALRNSMNAGLQHSGTYRKEASTAEKKNVKKTVRVWLKAFGSSYDLNEMNADKWGAQLDELCILVSVRHRNSLANGRFRLGIAHKMVSLYLKYLWLIDGQASKRPFFAVIDSGILKCSGSNENWTRVDKKDCLLSMLKKVDANAKREGFSSGAEWEAKKWSISEEED